MNITKENLDELNATLKIQLGEEDYSSRVDEVLKDYRKKVRLDGFRPGKVPAGLVRRMYRTPVLVEEINKLVSESVSNYIHEQNIRILGEPLPSRKEEKEIDWEHQTEFEFNFDLGLAPDLEISLSQRDKIPYYEIQIDRKMIEETKDSYAGRMGRMDPVGQIEGTENVKADFHQIDREGNPVEGGIHSHDAHFSMEVVKDDKARTALMARQVGDVVDIDIRKAFPNDNEIASLLKIDKSAVPEIAPNFRVTVKEIAKFVKAEFNQELFDRLYGKDEVKSMEEFDAKVEQDLKRGLKRDSEYRFKVDVKKALLKKFRFDLPVEFLKRWLALTNEDKFTAEQIEEDFPKFEDDLKWQLIRDQIVKDLEIKVEKEEIQAAARETALLQFQQYGMMNVPEENLKNYAGEMLKNDDERRRIIERILEKKVIDAVRDQVKLDNKQITVEKFNNLFENN